jgi:hypothetical protein
VLKVQSELDAAQAELSLKDADAADLQSVAAAHICTGTGAHPCPRLL